MTYWIVSKPRWGVRRSALGLAGSEDVRADLVDHQERVDEGEFGLREGAANREALALQGVEGGDDAGGGAQGGVRGGGCGGDCGGIHAPTELYRSVHCQD
ncbi:hypothetical protein GCM10020254_70360 [Streptomyces goshikiensis]